MHEYDVRNSTNDGEFSSFVVLPEGEGKAPAVLVIQEIFGVNAPIRETCRMFAREGFVASAPDLFWRQQAGVQLSDQNEADLPRALALYKGLDVNQCIEDLTIAIAALRRHPRCNGKVGVAGYCLGGLITYLCATRTDADAFSAYYGGGTDQFLGEADRITKPIIFHFAEKDHVLTLDAQAKVRQKLNHSQLATIHEYRGVGHAFARPGGQHFDRTAADLANSRTLQLFRNKLA